MVSDSWLPTLPHVDAASFAEAAAHAPVLVVQIWASWDPAGQRMDALLKRLSLEYRDRIEFRALDVDDEENFDFLLQNEVLTTPALLLFVRSMKTRLLHGLRPAAELRRTFDSLLEDWSKVVSHADTAAPQTAGR